MSRSAATQEWAPSQNGAADEIGSANLIISDTILAAVQLVKTGRSYPLAVSIDKNLPAFRYRSFNLTNVQPGEAGGTSLGPNKFTFNDELVVGWTGIGTH